MIAFDIGLNSEHICSAGVEQIGSLKIIIIWAKRIYSTSDEQLKFYLRGLVCDLEG